MTIQFDIQKASELLEKRRWLWHFVFWLLYAIFQARSYYITLMYYDIKYLEFMLLTRIPFVITVYFTLWLYAKLVYKRKLFLFIGIGIFSWNALLVAVVTFQKHYLKSIQEIAETGWSDIYLNQLPSYLTVFIIVSMCKYFKDNFINQYIESEKKRLQTLSELQNLKAQIAPHFLFNTMNNFYGLAVEQSAKLPELMVRLSDLLRYSLYETNNLKVPLLNEIAYLKNYIELEKIRLEDNLDFEFVSEIEENSTIEIAPLILVVFVENAFKHGKKIKDKAMYIRIKLVLEPDKTLLFEISNKCLNESSDLSYNYSGFGLENVKKRLSAIYPGQLHTLHIDKNGELFKVKLKLQSLLAG
jgi:two-component system, LytTR family, sensor histidine kinase LytS